MNAIIEPPVRLHSFLVSSTVDRRNIDADRCGYYGCSHGKRADLPPRISRWPGHPLTTCIKTGLALSSRRSDGDYTRVEDIYWCVRDG
ncbi:hypothetical protein Trydic_g16154 [Trypoxylus dichotomus]